MFVLIDFLFVFIVKIKLRPRKLSAREKKSKAVVKETKYEFPALELSAKEVKDEAKELAEKKQQILKFVHNLVTMG